MNVDRLIGVLEERGFGVGDAEGGTELTIACPLCFDEKRRLYISTANGLWMCFHCQARGHLQRLLVEVCGLNYNEAYTVERSIWGGAKRALPGRTSRPAPASPVGLPPGLVSDNGTGLAAEYLQSRGLSTRWVREFGLGFCLTGFYRHRVIIPVMTQGELCTFVARTWLKDEPKRVLMPKGSQAARALFGYDLITTPPELLVLSEGVFDALHLLEAGATALACLGAHLTDEQRVLIKRLRPGVVALLWDADEAGSRASWEVSGQLAASGLEVGVAFLPPGQDPASVSPVILKAALDNLLFPGIQCSQEVFRELCSQHVLRR